MPQSHAYKNSKPIFENRPEILPDPYPLVLIKCLFRFPQTVPLLRMPPQPAGRLSLDGGILITDVPPQWEIN